MKRIVFLLLALLVVVMPAYAQKSFDMRYQEAVEYYTTKQYDMAIKTLEAAKKAPGVTKDQTTKADQLIRQCRSALAKLSDLNLSKETLLAPGSGMRDSIYVTAGKKWSVTAVPDWCTTFVDSDILYITVAANEDEASRRGLIEVSMGKERTAYIVVNQDGRRDVSHTVFIRTVPERAMVYVDQNTGMLADQFSLKEGNHHVRIEKNGYERIDTVLVVPREPVSDDLYHRFVLTPNFALLSVDIKPEEGLYFDSNEKLDISGIPVDLKPASLLDFNVDQDISYYHLYEGNLIPLHPGQYVIRAESDGFKFAVKNVKVEKGETIHLDFTLSAIYGMLTVQDAENAVGARIFIDEKDCGEVPFNGKIKTGHHVLRFEKDGYLSENPQYEVEIEEGKDVLLNLSMNRFTSYRLTSDPAYCKVTVDGKETGTTPLNLQLTEGLHVLGFEKAGYYPRSEEIHVTGSAAEQSYQCHLDKTYPLVVTSDVDSLRIVISKGSGKNRVVYVDNVKTPGTVELPATKSLYKLQLMRSNLTKAYEGFFRFNGNRERLNVLSYSVENFQFLGVNFYLKRPAPCFTDIAPNPLNKDFQRLGDITFAELKLTKGLSTSAVRGAIFWPANGNSSITYPATGGNSPLAPGDENYKDVPLIPAATILFLNGDMRVGGAIVNNADVSVLASYAWYPNLSKIAPFTHMSGHDIFLGGELSSRFPFLNVNLKAGLQAFYGQANICRPAGTYKSSSNVIDRFYSQPYEVPYNRAQFVVTIGIKLGGKDSKGNNILRVF